jgi:hypothetical protein
MGAEDVTLGLEFRPAFGMVEKLTVADHGHGAVFVVDRLPAVLEPDNAQTAMRETDTRRTQKTRIVRTAMDQGSGHPLQHGTVRQPLSCKVDRSGDATHIYSFLLRRWPCFRHPRRVGAKCATRLPL